jgi:hypothetical protein
MQDESARDRAWQKYLDCDHDQNSPSYRPMSTCDVCRGRHSEESFDAGYDAGKKQTLLQVADELDEMAIAHSGLSRYIETPRKEASE